MASHFVITHTSHFKSYYKKLSPEDQAAIDNTIEAVVLYKQTGSAPFGLRIKQLRPKIYEARVDISTRLVFYADKNAVRFIALGNHDDILRTLKQIDKLS